MGGRHIVGTERGIQTPGPNTDWLCNYVAKHCLLSHCVIIET